MKARKSNINRVNLIKIHYVHVLNITMKSLCTNNIFLKEIKEYIH
jgi:hypothetical protein